MGSAWDDDIAALELSDVEKNGLQMYRNYKRAFDEHAEREFAKEIDSEVFDTGPLEKVLALITGEDVRFLPVIACAYVDELTESMFKAELPDNVPGGMSVLFGPYGPLSSLAKRLQLAFVFDALSADLVRDLERIRKVRNDIAHSWDTKVLEGFFEKGTISQLFPIEDVLAEERERIPEFSQVVEPQIAFRIRLIWILARGAYETAYYLRAKRAGLNPGHALFGPNSPIGLSIVSKLAMDAARQLIRSN